MRLEPTPESSGSLALWRFIVLYCCGQCLVQVSQIPRRFASGPASEIRAGEWVEMPCVRREPTGEWPLTLLG
jgi:hypothetical protein